MSTCITVWIDHASALIADFLNGEPRITTVVSDAESHHRSTGQAGVPPPGHIGGNVESHYENRRGEHLRRFYDQVIQRAGNCDALLIMGPGEAKHEFVRRMDHHSTPPGRTVQIEVAPRLTEGQLKARLREFVSAAAEPK